MQPDFSDPELAATSLWTNAADARAAIRARDFDRAAEAAAMVALVAQQAGSMPARQTAATTLLSLKSELGAARAFAAPARGSMAEASADRIAALSDVAEMYIAARNGPGVVRIIDEIDAISATLDRRRHKTLKLKCAWALYRIGHAARRAGLALPDGEAGGQNQEDAQ